MLFIAFLWVLFLPVLAYAGDTYWIHPSGASTWDASGCKSAGDPGAGKYCSLSLASTNAVAGDTVNLKAGTYTSHHDWGMLEPHNSGSLGSVITFQTAPGESQAVLDSSKTTSPYRAILIQNVSYIKIYNIKVYDSPRGFTINRGSYNEISYCTFDTTTANSNITCLNTAGECGAGSQHNWIHHNTFTKYGVVSGCDDGGLIGIGSNSAADQSYYNTIEDNNFSYGGHDLLNLQSAKFNVVRNNVFHNEGAYFLDDSGECANAPASGYFGNRNLILENDGAGTTDINLVEGNRLGHAGIPPEDDGSSGIENASEKTIIRYNFVYNNGAFGIYNKNQGTNPDYSHIYNNTVYYNGYGDVAIDNQFRWGIKNWCAVADNEPTGVVIKNNLSYGNWSSQDVSSSGNCSDVTTVSNNFTTDPAFVNTDISDPTSSTLPDLSLTQYSGARDCAGGTGSCSLTLANGAGTDSTVLTVDDALYFQAGSASATSPMGAHHVGVTTISADWICVGTVTNCVQITDVNYTTNVITLGSALSWADDAPVWLYKKSDGTIVLYGSAPDYGAHERNPANDYAKTTPGSGPKVTPGSGAKRSPAQ